MPVYLTESIVLKVRPLFESDKLVTFFSPDRGLIRSLAKGARRVKSRFGGRLEPLTWNQVLLAQGKTFDILSQCETYYPFYQLRADQEKLQVAVYWIKLIETVAQEGTPHPSLFRLMLHSLQALEQSKGAAQLTRTFELELLQLEGLTPKLESCVQCRSQESPFAYFSFHLGGVLCHHCLKYDVQASPLLDEDAALWHPSFWQEKVALTLAVAERGRTFIQNFMQVHLGGHLAKWMV